MVIHGHSPEKKEIYRYFIKYLSFVQERTILFIRCYGNGGAIIGIEKNGRRIFYAEI